MASAWVHRRATKKTGVRYRVEFRLGGRESGIRYAGTFATKKEAVQRRGWVLGELAAMRVPDVRLAAPVPVETLTAIAERWRTSRISVAKGTRTTHSTNLDRILPVLGERTPSAITKADVADLVVKLHDDGEGLARESIRKTISTLAMVLDHAEVAPNPARGVELPELVTEEVKPPIASHVEAVLGSLPRLYRLPLLLLDATGMRIGELESLTWGDVDEPAGRWRVSAARTKTRRARWVDVPDALLTAVADRVPREDRLLEERVFSDVTADRLRTAIARACKATATPLFSPHDLRHRRASLWHLDHMPAAQAAAWLGHSSHEHLRTYAHVVLDRRELDYGELLGRDRVVLARVLASS